MRKIKAYYTVETSLVMSVVLMVIFSVVTNTLSLYKKVENYSIQCINECPSFGTKSETMRLERMLCGTKDKFFKGDQ